MGRSAKMLISPSETNSQPPRNISAFVLNLHLRFDKLRVFTKPAFWNKSPDNCRVYYDQHSAFWSLWWRKTGITTCMSNSSTRSPRSLRLQSQGLETGWQPPSNHCVQGKMRRCLPDKLGGVTANCQQPTITWRFLVVHLCCDWFHPATASNHLPTDWGLHVSPCDQRLLRVSRPQYELGFSSVVLMLLCCLCEYFCHTYEANKTNKNSYH